MPGRWNLANAEGEYLLIINCLRQALRWAGHKNVPTDMDEILNLAWCEIEIERSRERKNVRANALTQNESDPFDLASYNLPDIEPWDIQMHGSTQNESDPFDMASYNLPDIEPWDIQMHESTQNESDPISSACPVAPENDDANIDKEEAEELGQKRERDPDWDLKTVTDCDGTYVLSL